jgi:hypothetical protein
VADQEATDQAGDPASALHLGGRYGPLPMPGRRPME